MACHLSVAFPDDCPCESHCQCWNSTGDWRRDLFRMPRLSHKYHIVLLLMIYHRYNKNTADDKYPNQNGLEVPIFRSFHFDPVH